MSRNDLPPESSIHFKWWLDSHTSPSGWVHILHVEYAATEMFTDIKQIVSGTDGAEALHLTDEYLLQFSERIAQLTQGRLVHPHCAPSTINVQISYLGRVVLRATSYVENKCEEPGDEHNLTGVYCGPFTYWVRAAELAKAADHYMHLIAEKGRRYA